MEITFTQEEQNRLVDVLTEMGTAYTISGRDAAKDKLTALQEDISVRIGYPEFHFKPMHKENIMHLTDILARVDSPVPVVGELGAWTGDSSTIIGDWLKTRKGGAHIIVEWFKGCIGVPEGDFRELFEDNMKEYEYELLDEESGEAAERIPDDTFDFFFIDADHRYHMVRRDIELWYPKVKKGGLLAGHDYDSEEYDELYIEDDIVDEVHHGVTKAVNERFGIPHNENHMWWIRK